MQSSHVFTNVPGDIPEAEMFKAQMKDSKAFLFPCTHTNRKDSLVHFLSMCA